MKILKNPNGIIYDTKNPDSATPYHAEQYGNPIPLHHTHAFTDYEFLTLFFPIGHPIFDDFDKSYFYWLIM